MKRFIRYLYEYEHGRRTRNVGFVKVEQDDDGCTVHIHGKGLRLEDARELKLYLFFEEDGGCVGVPQGTIDNVNPAVNYRLKYTPEDAGVPENYELIEGIVMESNSGRKYAAVWDDMPVDVNRMKVYQPEEEPPAEEEPQEMPVPEPEEDREPQAEEELPEEREEYTEEPESLEEPAAGDFIPHTEESETGEKEELSDELAPEDAAVDQPEPKEEPSDRPDPEVEATGGPKPEEEQDTSRSGSERRCTKIQRKDIARLPRCEWKLSNNSFLLHGYYNYHHLVFIEENDCLFLGVPGIYHEKEARAAEAFGFPGFVRLEECEITLAEDEHNEAEDFGYWCRRVRRDRRQY